MNFFTIAGIVGILVIFLGIGLAFLFVRLSQMVTTSQLALEAEKSSTNPTLTLGFEIPGAWMVTEEQRFIWLLRHPAGWEAFDAADQAYFASPERASFDPDPARLIQEQRNSRLTDVELP